MYKDKTSRGFIPGNGEGACSTLSRIELLDLMNSSIATDRTLAIRCLRLNGFFSSEDVEGLCVFLSKENALYVRIELETVLVEIGGSNIPVLLQFLGTIGSNQHAYRGKTSLKQSYPLPRDLIARIIAHFQSCDIEKLYKFIPLLPRKQFSELIDGIGFLSFYHPEYATEALFVKMMRFILSNYGNDELILWKFYTYCSAFSKECKAYDFLKQALSVSGSDSEIERSLSYFIGFDNQSLSNSNVI